jgi:hypothetical protein
MVMIRGRLPFFPSAILQTAALGLIYEAVPSGELLPAHFPQYCGPMVRQYFPR